MDRRVRPGTIRTERRQAPRIELVEIIQPNLALAGLLLQLGPNPGMPGKSSLAEGIGQGIIGLQIIGGGIQFQHLFGERTILGTDIFLELVQGLRLEEAGALVRIGADQDVHIIVFASFVQLVLVIRDHIAVHRRPEAADA